jgi:amino acid adenylation domain-containing protein
MHHIVSDGWSMGIFIRETMAIYASLQQGKPHTLPPLLLQYADFAAWQRGWLTGELLERQLSYWRRQLADLPTLNLPTDRPRPAVYTHHGESFFHILPAPLSQSLKQLSQQEGATLFMTLLTAWYVLLCRYSGQEDIAVGIPIAGRNRAESENLIGFFVNTLVLRGDLHGNPTCRELLAHVRGTALSAYDHQDVPFEKLVDELRPERDMGHTPLFQVMFNFLDMPDSRLDLPGLSFSTMPSESGTAKFDLTWEMWKYGDCLVVSCKYNTDLFVRATIERMVQHFTALLQSFVSSPETRLRELVMLSERENRQALVDWNLTAANFPRTTCWPTLFAAQVAATPQAIAVRSGETMWTYRQLDNKSRHLAHRLRALGVGPEVRVAICARHCSEAVAAVVAVLQAGGAFVPLDPAYPQERLEFVLKDAGVAVLLTHHDMESMFAGFAGTLLPLEAEIPEQPAECGEVTSDLHPDSLAYVIYTSGSSGKPKGVMVSQQSLVNYLWWVNRQLLPAPSPTLPWLSNLAFDASLKQVLAPLIRGDEVLVVPDDMVLRPDLLLAELGKRPQAAINCVPSLWKMLSEAMQNGSAPVPPVLTRLLIGGEQVSRELPKESWQLLPHLTITNLYGPTETTANALSGTLALGEEISLGRPLANTQVYVLDAELQPVSIGVTGEIHIAGVGLARGYLGRPDFTADKFVPNPFAGEPGERLYKTGDMGRYLSDGRIEFVGRLDDQVKIRGFRIELGEIETVLATHPAVREAVVMARGEKTDKSLVAYVVARPGNAADTEELRQFMRRRLPEYMIPAHILFLAKLPLNANGKIDRKALPALEQRQQVEASLVAPRDRLEWEMACIWQEILGSDSVGVDDNFFALGGHSLLAVRLMAQIGKKFGVSLPLSALFAGPSVAQLASVVRRSETLAATPLVAIQPKGKRVPFFCVHPAGGNVLCFAALARALGEEQPFYGLEAKGLHGKEQPLTRVEDMADYYAKAVRECRPHGPYFLGGWSLGGVVALATAALLCEADEKVELLALFDAPVPGMVKKSDDADVLAAMAQNAHVAVNSDEIRSLAESERFAYVLAKARAAKALPPEVDEQQLRQLFAVYYYNVMALSNYVPKIYPGKIVLFQAAANTEKETHAAGWQKFAGGGFEVCPCSGSHTDMIAPPYVTELARELQRRLG